MTHSIVEIKSNDGAKRRELMSVVVARKTLPDVKKTVLKDFKEIMMNMGQWEERRFNKTECIYTFRNGATISFMGLADEAKARGLKCYILFVNEATEWDFEVFFQARRRNTGFTILDYNPTYTSEHWINEVNADKRTYFFISTFLDNPFLGQTEIDEVLSYRQLHPDLWTIYGEGKCAVIDGLVFPAENWDIIEEGDFPDWASDGFIGIDWGWDPDPTVIVHVIIEGNDIYVKEIVRENEMYADDIANRLEPYYGIQKYCDVDKRLVATLEREGIPLLKTTDKDRTTILTGIRILNQRKIHITENSTGLIKEFRNYVYKKDRNGVVHTDVNPIDKFNHGIDALRYVALEEFDNESPNRSKRYKEPLTKESLGIPI